MILVAYPDGVRRTLATGRHPRRRRGAWRPTGQKGQRITANIDDELLADAARAFGTSGPTATLTGALREVVREERIRGLLAHDFSDLTPEALERMRRERAG